jgi:hypothetical protein
VDESFDPIILDSARKHGIQDEDILHAYRNPVRSILSDELTMIIGGDQSGRLLEIGLVERDGEEFVCHAMNARKKFLE